MVRPGVNITSRVAVPPRGAPTDTGVAFMAGLTERGRTDQAVLIRNMTEYGTHFGGRVSYGLLYDSLETFFREGGTEAYVARVVGPAATKDTITLNDAVAAPSIAVDSIGEGAVGLTAQVVAGSAAGTFVLVIALDGVEVERSYDLADPAAAVAWATASSYVRVRALGAGDPAVIGATALATGDDQRGSITDTERATALSRFTKALGPGQVLYPGATTSSIAEALLEHAQANNRFALLDGADTPTSGTLTAAADAIRALGTLAAEAEEFGMLLAPWILVPGLTRGTTRTVPPSALAAGLMARSDAETGNPNEAAAGSAGESRYAVGLSQPEWTDALRETLNTKGVNVFRSVYGAVRLYGFRTLTDPVTAPGYLAASNARLRMAISAEADALGEEFLFDQLDGRGVTIAKFNGGLAGILLKWWNLGALYGNTAEEAFAVDTGAAVNTPTTLSNNELRAVLSTRMSPFGEAVTMEIVKVAITESL